MIRKLTPFLFAFAIALTLYVSPPLVQAQQPGIIDRIKSSITGRVERLYLLLPGQKPGQTVLRQSMMAMESVTSSNVSVEAGADVMDQAETSLAKAKITVSGPVEMKSVYDPSTSKQSLSMAGDLTLQGTTMRVAADVKVDGKTLYFQLNELPVLPFVDLTALKGQWLKVTATESAKTNTELTPTQREEIKAATTKLLTAAEFTPAKRETKEGHKVFVTQATVPSSALVEYFTTLETIKPNETTTPAETQKKVEEFFKGVDNVIVTFWVDSNNYYLRHVETSIKKEVPAEDVAESGIAGGSSFLSFLNKAKQVDLSFSMSLDAFNQPITFSAPADAKEAEQAVNEIMSTGIFGGTVPVTTPSVKTSIDTKALQENAQMQAQIEALQKQAMQRAGQ